MSRGQLDVVQRSNSAEDRNRGEGCLGSAALKGNDLNSVGISRGGSTGSEEPGGADAATTGYHSPGVGQVRDSDVIGIVTLRRILLGCAHCQRGGQRID